MKMSLRIVILVITQLCMSNVLLQLPPTPPIEVTPAERQFRVVYEWNTLNFGYKKSEDRLDAIYKGEFIPKNIIISDVKPYANRLYVSIPRMLPGVPATLGYFVAPNNDGKTDPDIDAFPSWEMNERGNCSALQFVQGIAIDAYGILWAVDSGRTETLAPSRKQVTCTPKLILMDLKRNGSVILRYEFPEDVVPRGTNYLNKIVIDDAFGGFAYITDNSGADPGIVVFSKRLNRSWKVRENNSMRAAQNAVDFIVNGTDLSFSIHIDAIALGPYYNPNIGNENSNGNDGLFNNQNYERNIYYSPLSSYHLYSIPASLLRDPDFARRATPREILEAVTDHGIKASQTDGMIMDNQGVLYYGLLNQHAIAKWDSYKPFTFENQQIIAKDPIHIQWIDGMGFDEEGHIYVIINRLHNFVAGRLNPDEVNFRMLRAKTGTQSYVYTGENLFNTDEKVRYEGSFENTNGLNYGRISSTTPIYSQLGAIGGGRRYRNSSSALEVNIKTIFSLILATFSFTFLSKQL